MELVLTRRWLDEKRSIGELSVDGAPECFTLEDRTRLRCRWCSAWVWEDIPWCKLSDKHDASAHEWVQQQKVPKETAIPLGRYEVKIEPSQRYKRLMPRLQRVPEFVGILIHAGNTERDTEGCILVGVTRDKDRILNSRLAFEKLYQKLADAALRGEQIFITLKLGSDLERAVC